MTLEDFFTLTEINNGLETPLRIQELVAVIQKEKDVNGSIADATKQWSAVASTIAATDNKDCLQLFTQLDGLNFLDNWLTKAQFFHDSSDDNYSIEESITVLLRAVEKLLHVGNEELASSGIRVSVQKLIGHTSSKVQEMAKALIDRWKKGEENASGSVDGEPRGVSVYPEEEKPLSGSPCMDVHPSKDGCNNQDRDMNLPSLRSDEETSNKISDFVNSSSLTKHISSDVHDEEEESTKLLHPEGPEHGTLNELTEKSDDSLKGRPITRSSDGTVLSPSPEAKDATGKESGSENHCRSTMVVESNESPKSNVERLHDLENIGGVEVDDDLSDQSEDDLPFGKLYMGNKDATDMLGKRSDLDLDPLEVALQVAIEVGREFEQNCISVKKTAKVHHEESPNSSPLDSEIEKHCETTTTDTSNKGGAQEGICHPPTDDDDTSQVSGKNINNSEINETQDLDSEKGMCDFDLNREVKSEEEENADRPPIAVSNAESDGSSEQQQIHGCSRLDIDLNVAEGASGRDERCVDLNIREEDMAAPAWEEDESSSVEVASGSKMRERVDLDLNRITDGDEEEAHPSDWRRMDRHQLSSSPTVPHRSQSPPSSTASFLNIDLNEGNPVLGNDYSSLSYFTNPQPAVSIMGMRVDRNQKEHLFPKMPSDPVLDVNNRAAAAAALGMESLFSYAHSASGYDHVNGITAPVPFSSLVYGPTGGSIPYMVDFRGMPVMPQIVGPASSSFHQQQPFIIPLGNGALMMPSRNGFDLNNGGLTMASAYPPTAPEEDFGGGLRRQTLHPLLQPNSQPSTSLSIGGKRKEPDAGWGDTYPFDINHRQPPWK
ncbi:unnamed protein product [Cuscuta campestris]|uniref:TFIIS N-terminal domain-containing protein n=1 Tax=Cuscuta campestris TaxID=132261 RepID=A0A484KEW6_9ASTE|nr:unnamed protein product [Cuscuta campestris]